MIKFLLKEFENTSVLVALTTHIADAERNKRVICRNNMAKEIADKYKLPVIDLYTASYESKVLLSNDGVHFIPEGYELLAGKIIQTITKLIPNIEF